MPNLTFGCPVVLSSHYDVPVDNTDWFEPFNYHQVPRQGQTPHRPKAPFPLDNALNPRAQASNFDSGSGVYILAIDHPHKAFYVGIAATGDVGARLRTHRVKLTASHVGQSLPCGTPATVGGVHHPLKWRRFAAQRYQYHLAAGAEDQCADLRLMLGTIEGDNGNDILTQYESGIIHNAGGVRDRILSVLWPDEDNSKVVMLNTPRGAGPDIFPGEIVLPDKCPERHAEIEFNEPQNTAEFRISYRKALKFKAWLDPDETVLDEEFGGFNFIKKNFTENSISDYKILARSLLLWGGDLEVLRPIELRNAVRECIEYAYEIYQSEQLNSIDAAEEEYSFINNEEYNELILGKEDPVHAHIEWCLSQRTDIASSKQEYTYLGELWAFRGAEIFGDQGPCVYGIVKMEINEQIDPYNNMLHYQGKIESFADELFYLDKINEIKLDAPRCLVEKIQVIILKLRSRYKVE